MTRARTSLLLVCFALWPTVATAQWGWWEFLENLSGPGPFNGWNIEWRVVCFPDKSSPKPADQAASTPRFVTIPGCLFNPLGTDERRRGSINIAFGILEAEENNLRYADPAQDDEVTLTSVKSSLWWSPVRYIELGMSGGIFWFGGPAFESFWRVYFEPLQVDVKPLPWLLRSSKKSLEILSFRAGLVLIPRGFRAEDFGALPGTFKSSREVIPTVTFILDLDPLLPRR
jgi:hypothetical protein